MAESARPLGDIATKLLFENARVRIWEMKIQPGEVGGLRDQLLRGTGDQSLHRGDRSHERRVVPGVEEDELAARPGGADRAGLFALDGMKPLAGPPRPGCVAPRFQLAGELLASR